MALGLGVRGGGGGRVADLFPTRMSFVIFILYIAFFVLQGILVTASQTSNHQGYKYNTVMAVLLTEVIKLLVSAGVFIHSVHKTDMNPSTFNYDGGLYAKKNDTTDQIKDDPINNTNSSHFYSHMTCRCFNLNVKNCPLCFRQYKRSLTPRIFNQCFKLLRNSATIFFKETRQHSKMFLLYFVPAGLYCMYNNLSYTNLVNFDPTTYYLLLQFRVMFTGVVFQCLFNKRLSRFQWMSLAFLTVGCMIKEVKFGWLLDPHELNTGIAENPPKEEVTNVKKLGLLENPFGILFIAFQILCSSSAGVYNEYLLKKPASGNQKKLPVLIQNVCLYLDSIVCNVVLLLIQGEIGNLMSLDSLKTILTTPITVAVVFNNAAIGIVTSFFLAQLNVIIKSFASALELMFTAILCWFIFGFPIYLNTAVAISIVMISIWLYAKEPVQNNPHSGEKQKEEDMQAMLEEELDV